MFSKPTYYQFMVIVILGFFFSPKGSRIWSYVESYKGLRYKSRSETGDCGMLYEFKNKMFL